jgi:hypothetical protein
MFINAKKKEKKDALSPRDATCILALLNSNQVNMYRPLMCTFTTRKDSREIPKDSPPQLKF